MRIRLQARPLISLTLLAFMASGVFAQPIQTWRLGSDVDTPAFPLGGMVLSGGAGEVDPAMQWFLQRANGGDVLVLSVSGGAARWRRFRA